MGKASMTDTEPPENDSILTTETTLFHLAPCGPEPMVVAVINNSCRITVTLEMI